jgi:NAD(P)-dependent dehydrogenase (short-subunit alcohol dehydrogenase family)
MGLLEGDTALITGVASGIGRGIAKALGGRGLASFLAISPNSRGKRWRAN